MMEDTIQSKTTFDHNLRLYWKLGSVLVILFLFFAGQFLTTNPKNSANLVVYAFSAEEDVFTQGIFPAFEKIWEAETQGNLSIKGVFGPSGTLAGQINLGAPADIAVFSSLNQVSWLQLGEMVSSEARSEIIGASPIVIVTRPGLSQDLEDLADLSMPGLDLLHADPHSSGVAEWALLAEYGDALKNSGDTRVAEAQLQAIWRNVRILAPSARALLNLFELGMGDAFLTYEQDALFAQARGVPLEIATPSQTIIAQPVAVVVDRNVKRSEQAVVQAFVDFLISKPGQEIFSQYYLRPVGLKHTDFPSIEQPFTVEDLGGWNLAYTERIKPFWESEIEAGLDLEPVPVYLNPGR